MNFLSDHFLLFLPVALFAWYATRAIEWLRIVLMIVASLVFYADDHWWFVAIILAYCVVDWTVGRALQASRAGPCLLPASPSISALSAPGSIRRSSW